MTSGCLFVNSRTFPSFSGALNAALDELSSTSQMFAMVFINYWSASRQFCTIIKDSIELSFKQKSRNQPLEVYSNYYVDQDKLKRWLCLIESRESDCLVINNGSGLLQSGSIECNGIETDIVVQVYAVCESGKCKNSTLNPVVSTRAKAKLIITKFKMEECEKCGYSSKTAIQSRVAEALKSEGQGVMTRKVLTYNSVLPLME